MSAPQPSELCPRLPGLSILSPPTWPAATCSTWTSSRRPTSWPPSTGSRWSRPSWQGRATAGQCAACVANRYCDICCRLYTDLCVQAVDFSEHVTRYHQLARLDYLKIFPAEEDKFPCAVWRCRICGEEAGLRGARRHLQDHAITLEDYNRTFAYLEPKHEVKNEVKQQQTAVRRPTPGSPWYESKKTTCRMCSKTFWHGQFIKHIKVEHGHNLRDYKSVFPEQDLEVGSTIYLTR